jgi:putative ABC transport system permease protein
MFDTKFQYGYGWTTEHGEQRARVVVISKRLNDSLFGGTNSVGRSIRVASHLYRIIGVLRKWTPQPKFYSLGLGGRSYGASDDVYIPLHSARADKMQPETVYCWHAPGPELESSSCVWMSIWVQLEHPLDKSSYKTFLSHYADMQKRVGRFGNSNIWLPDLPQFLSQQQVVPSNVYLQVYLALGFLLLCIIGAAGLQLAKTASRRSEIDIRRALGASRSLIFSQYMVESATLGTLGALLGIGLGELGLWEIRSLPVEYAHLAHLRADMLAVAVALAIVASLMAGLLPAWRACAIDPQLK